MEHGDILILMADKQEPSQERICDPRGSQEINPDAPKHPFVVELTAGERISWCTCGYSSKEPFCDGSHRECTKGLRSFKHEPETTGKVALCGCKRSSNPPFCDGTHSRL